LAAVADLRSALGPDVPMLMTVFTPMSIAADLAGGPQDLAALIAQDPPLVHVGLRTITDTFTDFAARCIAAGADGLFLATTHVATWANFTPEQYKEFGRPYDLEVLAAARAAPLNLLHVCKAQAFVRELADYPVALLNWDTAEPSNPGLTDMIGLAGGKALVGGLNRRLFVEPRGKESLLRQAQAAREAMAGRPFVLGSTCTIDTKADPEAVRAVRESVEHV
jgi:uroporphyrinogen decarboxylase